MRDAHPKSHGCVTATFKVENNLSFPHDGRTINLAHGVFTPGAAYDALIRFSSSNADPTRSDIKRDGRGMAIKLLGVPGKKLAQTDSNDSQDFIMISHPVFMIDNPADYLRVIEAVNAPTRGGQLVGLLRLPAALGVRGLQNAAAITSLQIANPLQARYWSMVPYQLGAGEQAVAVKYSARSCTALRDPLPANPATDFLRMAMRDTLEKEDACMEFLVQPRTSGSQDVEDSKTEWLEAEAPFHKVATITIPHQVFDTEPQNQSCDNLAFNPWHALPEHRPLGAVNRMRMAIYPEISTLRRSINASSSDKTASGAQAGS